MARPNKMGLDYFPFDVDFFNDEKIVAISGEFGIKGEIVVIKLLCAIYRNGYFILWNDLLKFKLLRDLPGVSSELLDSIMNRLVLWGFFDKDLFDSMGVLTSAGIQKRYFKISKRRKSVDDFRYLLIKVSGCENKEVFSSDDGDVSSDTVNVCIKEIFSHNQASDDLMVHDIQAAIRRCHNRTCCMDCVVYYAHGYSYKEIGKMVGIPVNTVRSRISYGRELLRNELDLTVK